MNSCVWPDCRVPTECRFHTLLNRFCLSFINNYSSLVATSATVEGNGDGFGRSGDTIHEDFVRFCDRKGQFLSPRMRESSVPKHVIFAGLRSSSSTDAAHCAEFVAASHLT